MLKDIKYEIFMQNELRSYDCKKYPSMYNQLAIMQIKLRIGEC